MKSLIDLSLRSSSSWWAATISTYCPGRMAEHLVSKSTLGFYRSDMWPCRFVARVVPLFIKACSEKLCVFFSLLYKIVTQLGNTREKRRRYTYTRQTRFRLDMFFRGKWKNNTRKSSFIALIQNGIKRTFIFFLALLWGDSTVLDCWWCINWHGDTSHQRST